MPKYNKHRWKGKLEQEPGQDGHGAGEADNEVSVSTAVGEQQQLQLQQPAEKSGRRIVELSVLGQQLWCVSCKEALSLDNIESEHRRGLGSILLVRCHKCLIVNTVCTDKKHESALEDRNIRFDINFKAATGTLQTGIGWTQFNRLLACMNIPTIDFKTYKRYKERVENIQIKKEAVTTTANSADKDNCKKESDVKQDVN